MTNNVTPGGLGGLQESNKREKGKRHETLSISLYYGAYTHVLKVCTRECVLYIGSQSSNLYTAVNTPARVA